MAQIKVCFINYCLRYDCLSLNLWHEGFMAQQHLLFSLLKRRLNCCNFWKLFSVSVNNLSHLQSGCWCHDPVVRKFKLQSIHIFIYFVSWCLFPSARVHEHMNMCLSHINASFVRFVTKSETLLQISNYLLNLCFTWGSDLYFPPLLLGSFWSCSHLRRFSSHILIQFVSPHTASDHSVCSRLSVSAHNAHHPHTSTQAHRSNHTPAHKNQLFTKCL